MISRARTKSTPLCARSRWYSTANSSRSGELAGFTMLIPLSSTPWAAATSSTSCTEPRTVKSHTSRRCRISAAASTRPSVPSGRTMCLRSLRARSMSSWRKRSGVIVAGRGRVSRSSSSASSTLRAQAPMAAATLRRCPVVISLRTSLMACATLYVSSSSEKTGKGACARNGSTCGSGGRPPVRTMPLGTGNSGENAEASEATMTSARSPGTMTRSLGSRRFRKLPTVMAATLMAWTSRSSSGLPAIWRRPKAAATSPTVGREISAISGITYTGR